MLYSLLWLKFDTWFYIKFKKESSSLRKKSKDCNEEYIRRMFHWQKQIKNFDVNEFQWRINGRILWDNGRDWMILIGKVKITSKAKWEKLRR